MGQAWIFLLITIICWGITPILEKFGLKNLDAFSGLFIRSAAVFFILLIAFIGSGKISSLSKVPLKTIIIFSITGILAGLVGMWTYFKVLKINPSSKIVPLAATYPLVTAILGVYILKEEFSWPRIVGTVLIVAGIFLVK
jgi:transporter family protein